MTDKSIVCAIDKARQVQGMYAGHGKHLPSDMHRRLGTLPHGK